MLRGGRSKEVFCHGAHHSVRFCFSQEIVRGLTIRCEPLDLGLRGPLVDKPSEPVRVKDLDRAVSATDQTAALEGFQ
jgi:hypothetical protein